MKKTVAKYLCIILSVALLLTALPLTVYADSNEIEVGNADELTTACNEINTNGGEYTIKLTDDIIGGHIGIKKSSAVVTVIGNGHTITNPRNAVYVSDGAKVILGDGNSTLTLQGSVEPHITPNNTDDPGIIYVLPGSTCTMSDNVTLKNHKGNNYFGGGVSVSGGTFVMNGGTIENCGIDGGSVCFGGGVAVYNGGYFTMNGGTISNCYAITDYVEEDPLYENSYSGIGGGVFVTDASVFTMNGGTISNNTATNFGGGVAMTLSDIETQTDPNTGKEKINPKTGKGYVDLGNPRSKVTINSGTLSGNIAKYGAGIFVSGLIYAFADVFYHKPLVAGDSENPGLYINGGENKTVEISSNKADEMGGGVMIIGLRDTRKAQIHNTKIINNTAAKGAGIEVYSFWTETHIDGCMITGNNATNSGGGVSLEQDLENGTIPGKTYLKDTVVTNNTSGEIGAGVFYNNASNLMISGANIIQNNTYNGKPNNLNVLDKDYPVYVDGDLTGSQIGLSDPTLWNDDKEDIDADAVSTIRLTDGYKANNDTLIPYNAFTSDHESWVVDYGEKKTEQGAEIGRTYTYTAEKYHNVINVTDGGPIVIQGSKRHIRLKAVTPNLSKADNLDTIYSDMLERYNKKYEKIATNRYGDPVFYDKISNKYVSLYQYGTMVYIFVGDYDAAYWEIDSDCDCLLYAGESHQQFAQDGEIVYQYQGINPNEKLFTNPEYESTAQTVNLVYDKPLDFNGEDTLTLLERNDLGIITDKLVVEKQSENVDIQYDTVTTDYTNEVRLVRKKPNYHINNTDIANAKYNGDDIFTSYVEAATKEIKVGDTIEKFYTIPEVKATESSSCPYIFKGWYYDKDNDNDSNLVNFGTDKYSKDIYAHWIKVENVAKNADDDNELPPTYNNSYGGFDLVGVQVREGIRDTNYGYEKKPGGLRFVTSLNMDVVNQINAIKPNNIEYGYVAATNEGWINYHSKYTDRKLQYASTNTNGIDTSSATVADDNYFGFASNINCTSRRTNSGGIVKEDHRNFDNYLLYTLVITYENVNDDAKDKNVLARPYIKYFDANGLERVAYSEYKGRSNKLGGCYTSYNAIAGNN